MVRWRDSTEIMQPRELEAVAADAFLSTDQLKIAAWEPGERERQAGYVTQMNGFDMLVWREDGKLAWKVSYPLWYPEDKVNLFHWFLKEQGFTGTRREDHKLHAVIFQQGEQRLEFRFSKRADTSNQVLMDLARDFLHRCHGEQ